MKGRITLKSECANLHCLRDRQFVDGAYDVTRIDIGTGILYQDMPTNALALAKHDMSRDANGLYWCQLSQCQQRYELIQWGAAHNWPAVTVGRYSILDEWECWKVAIMLGNQDAIEWYYAALIQPVDDSDAIDVLLPDENESEQENAAS